MYIVQGVSKQGKHCFKGFKKVQGLMFKKEQVQGSRLKKEHVEGIRFMAHCSWFKV